MGNETTRKRRNRHEKTNKLWFNLSVWESNPATVVAMMGDGAFPQTPCQVGLRQFYEFSRTPYEQIILLKTFTILNPQRFLYIKSSVIALKYEESEGSRRKKFKSRSPNRKIIKELYWNSDTLCLGVEPFCTKKTYIQTGNALRGNRTPAGSS